MLTYIEIVDLQELEKIHAHQLEPDAQVLPKYYIVIQVDHIHDVLWVVFFEELEDLIKQVPSRRVTINTPRRSGMVTTTTNITIGGVIVKKSDTKQEVLLQNQSS